MEQPSVFKKTANWRNINLYHKADTLYWVTAVFCKRFLPEQGDHTVERMVQAARNGKQNIAESSEEGKAGTEAELKLLNMARTCIGELREDYEDYLKIRDLPIWQRFHPRFDPMLSFCRQHNDFADYAPLMKRMTDEEMCNMSITLCHITDKMLMTYLKYLESRFATEGGAKERMHTARTGYHRDYDNRMRLLEEENNQLKTEVQRLKVLLATNGITF